MTIYYVGSGSYRESLTVDISGTAGNPITYIGDYTGANTDGVGGVVRITGSADDIALTRSNCITVTAKDYRTFRGFVFDLSSSYIINITSGTNWIVEDCYFGGAGGSSINFLDGSAATGWTIRRCGFLNAGRFGIEVTDTVTVADATMTVENCIFNGTSRGISTGRVGGITVRNCLFVACSNGVRVATALAGGSTVTINNCIFYNAGSSALHATATGEITENYNALFNNTSDRTNVSTGANSNSYPPLLDARWFFEMVNG